MRLFKKVLIYIAHRQAHIKDEQRKTNNRYQAMLILKDL